MPSQLMDAGASKNKPNPAVNSNKKQRVSARPNSQKPRLKNPVNAQDSEILTLLESNERLPMITPHGVELVAAVLLGMSLMAFVTSILKLFQIV